MEWEKLATLSPIYLNLGGNQDCHPKEHYEHYVALDLRASGEWGISYDLSQKIPLPDESVDRILSEHFFEHIPVDLQRHLLRESYRLLKPGAHLRIAVPDYNNPRDKPYRIKGHDPRHIDHALFPTYESLTKLFEDSPFQRWEFYHYWTKNGFVHKPIDYNRGWLKRTPDHDRRNFRLGTAQKIKGAIKDLLFLIKKGFRPSIDEWQTVWGRPYRVTSIVVDLYKS